MLRLVVLAVGVQLGLSQAESAGGGLTARLFSDSGAGTPDVPEPYDPIGRYQRLKEPIFNEVPRILRRIPTRRSLLPLAPRLPNRAGSAYPRPRASTNQLLFSSRRSHALSLPSSLSLFSSQPRTSSASSAASPARPQLTAATAGAIRGFGFRGFWGYPGLLPARPAQPAAAAATYPAHLPSQPSADAKPSEETQKAYEAAQEAYNAYMKALIEAKSKKAIDGIEGKGSATRLKSTGKCDYHFDCETGNLCFGGQCLPVGGTHKGQSCGSRFSEDCPEGEACFQFTCFPASTE